MANQARIEITADDRTRQVFASIERNFTGMQRSAEGLARTFSGLGGLLSAGAFIAFTRNAVASAAALDDMAESTGATVEGLSKLTDIARIGGQDIGQIETALVRLTKALAGSDEETKGAGAAFAALGLNIRQLQALAPDQALEKVAQAFARFEDGAGKTSAALALFGRSGAQLLPLLKDIAEQSDRVVSLTSAEAAAAEKLEKQWNSLTVSAGNLARNGIVKVVEAFQTLQKEVRDKGIAGTLRDIVDPQSVLSLQQQVAALRLRLDEARRVGDAGAESQLTGELAGVVERLRKAQALTPPAPPAALPALPIIPSTVSASARTARAAAAIPGLGAEVPGFQDESVVKENERLRKLADSYKAIADPLQKYRDQLDEIRSLREKNLITAEEATEAEFAIAEAMDKTLGIMERLPEQAAQTNDLVKELGLTFTSAFEDAIVGGKKLSEVLRALGQDILKIATRKLVTEPLGGIASGLFGDLFKSLGFRAEGGSVFPGNAYVVGERGPELFVPRQAGTVLPNGAGAISVTLNVSTGVASTVRAEFMNLLPAIQQAAIAAVADARLRGASV